MQARHFLPCLVLVSAGVALLLATGVSASGLGVLAVVLACPLMMFFMMRSMGGHGGDHAHHQDTESKQSS